MQGKELPFNFELFKEGTHYKINLINGEEKLLVDEISVKNDSLHAVLHIFDTELKASIGADGKTLEGVYVKNYVNGYQLPFRAEAGENYRFVPLSEVSELDLNGRYEVKFVPDKEDPPYRAIGEFQSYGNDLTGTFLTPTGDYRYLQGNIVEKRIYLSAFDGNHAFIFEADISGDSLVNGEFWSGQSWHETWHGVKNQLAELPHPDSLTYLKKGYDGIAFEFPDLNGKPVSLSDAKYQNKALILQILGTWCPNCMDETRFLRDWYERNKAREVEIIGLAYEQKDDFNYARGRVAKMIEKLDVPYDFVIAGTSDKEAASKTLPMLNHIMSFPTLVVLNRNHEVVKIHTGFSGPGTGIHYEKFVEDFNEMMEGVLQNSSES